MADATALLRCGCTRLHAITVGRTAVDAYGGIVSELEVAHHWSDAGQPVPRGWDTTEKAVGAAGA
jgi:hypothetical protein